MTLRPILNRAALSATCAAGLILYFGASRLSVFDDEAFSCRRYAMPMSEMLSALWHGAEPDPPLFYILQNAWIRLFGIGPLAIRSLPILLFLAGLLAIRQAGRSWFDRRTGDLAMLLSALHPAHLLLGFAARWYSLMFLTTALLAWATGRWFRNPAAAHGRLIPAWSLAAAAVCYTNYFGIAVVVLFWAPLIASALTRRSQLRPSLYALALAGILYTPWAMPFLHQVSAVADGGNWLQQIPLSAYRTLSALAAGNWASADAWWIWTPLAIACIAVAFRLPARFKTTAPVFITTLSLLIVGIVSGTLIDKYVMCLTAPACLTVAGLVMPHGSDFRRSPRSTWVFTLTLAIAWIGCAVNAVTQRHWSSLRWLDPFEQAISDLASDPGISPDRLVMTHPAARYYFALEAARRATTDPAQQSVSPAQWRRYAERPSPDLKNVSLAAATPHSILPRIQSGEISSLVTLETAGFSHREDWRDLDAELSLRFQVVAEKKYLHDADAALKNRLDPSVHHPEWRIIVRRWRRTTLDASP